MFHRLPTAYADVDHRALRWALGLRPSAALVSLPVAYGDLRIELAILGASHQVLVSDADGMRWSETVACGVTGDPLPGRAQRTRAGTNYLLTSSVQRLSPDEFDRRVDDLLDALRDEPYALVGAFPGDQRAVTALTLDAPDGGAGLAWRTWHSYPQSGHLVTTHSLLQRPGLLPPPGLLQPRSLQHSHVPYPVGGAG